LVFNDSLNYIEIKEALSTYSEKCVYIMPFEVFDYRNDFRLLVYWKNVLELYFAVNMIDNFVVPCYNENKFYIIRSARSDSY